MAELITYLDDVEREYSTLIIDSKHPSLYAYKGVALYNAQRMEDAEESFLKAVSHTPWDTRSWINIGEIRVQSFNIKGAIMAFSQAFKQNDMNALGHLLRTKGWLRLENFEFFYHGENVIRCTDAHNGDQGIPEKIVAACEWIDGSAGLEYIFLQGKLVRYFMLLAQMRKRGQSSSERISPRKASVMKSSDR